MPGDRVAFDHLARRRAQIAGLCDKLVEDIGRQKVALDDKPVAVEAPAVIFRDQPSQTAAARLRKPIGGGDPRRMQPVFVEPAIADDRIARKEFFLAENLGHPERHQQGLSQRTTALRFRPHPRLTRAMSGKAAPIPQPREPNGTIQHEDAPYPPSSLH